MNIYLTQTWNELLYKFEENQKDIYFHEEYVKLYEDEKSSAFCVVCEEGYSTLLLPFLRREIDGYYDFETAYGYGGPISNSKDAVWIHNAIDAIKKFLIDQKYICGFIRFHPLLENQKLCVNCFDVFLDRSTVIIDTKMSSDEIWTKQICSKNRNMIRKAEKNGLVYKAEYDFQSIDEFINLYNATMTRLNADKFYLFSKNYYKEFCNHLANHAFLGTIRKDNKLVCGALFMFSKEYGHYHLEGSSHDYSHLGANNLLLWKTALELHNLNVKEFHLGGGSDSSENNSLLKFKKAFSHQLGTFYVGKIIFNEIKYNEIKYNWMKQNPERAKQYEKLLLCYRY